MPTTLLLATFGGGCFWCLEAAFQQLNGVESVVSGYAAGHTTDPTYERISTGQTGHAEVVQIHFNPNNISYEQLLDVFFTIHDPTTLNRQGNDVGTQYRSIILTHDTNQAAAAQAAIQALEDSQHYHQKIVTEIEPLTQFYPAEDVHQNYFQKNPSQAYCRLVVKPKVDKVQQEFAPLLKSF